MAMANETIAGVLGMLTVFWVFYLAVIVLIVIALWKTFEKAGEPGWAALIPYYNAYEYYKISWGNGWYFLLTAIPALICQGLYFGLLIGTTGTMMEMKHVDEALLESFFTSPTAIVLCLLIITLAIEMIVISIITYVKLAKVFGQGGGFACGLIFLSAIFICILGFSKDILYVGIPGKRPGNPQYGQQNKQYPPYNNPPQGYSSPYIRQDCQPSNPQTEECSFCTGCGARIDSDVNFCPCCGKEVQRNSQN